METRDYVLVISIFGFVTIAVAFLGFLVVSRTSNSSPTTYRPVTQSPLRVSKAELRRQGIDVE